MHHFRFTSDHPGVVFVKNADDMVERKINLLKNTSWKPTPANLPQQIILPGLSEERKVYLYQKIREYCSDDGKNIVCPKPATTLS